MIGQQSLFDHNEGKRRAEEGEKKALYALSANQWRQAAESWFFDLRVGARFTADDLIKDIGLPSEGVAKNNAVGGLFAALSKSGLIEVVGFASSERVIRHSSLQRVWKKL